MTSVQHLRAMAQTQGNLVTTPQQEVIVEGGVIQVWPANPRLIFVPVYDPAIVYVLRPSWGLAISFGMGFLIGAWLNHDCDWGGHRVIYTGWRGGSWVGRSRPYVQVTNVYVNNRYTNVVVNRNVVNRTVNFANINRYNSVHRDVNFGNHARGAPPPNPNYRPPNQNIDRNINTRDPRLDQYRGHANQQRPAQPSERQPYSRPGRKGQTARPRNPQGPPLKGINLSDLLVRRRISLPPQRRSPSRSRRLTPLGEARVGSPPNKHPSVGRRAEPANPALPLPAVKVVAKRNANEIQPA